MSMKRALIALSMLTAIHAPSAANEGVVWSSTDLTTLKRWVEMAPQDALPRLSTTKLEAAIDTNQPEQVDSEATSLALRLARMHLLGNATSAERSGWNIVDSDSELPLESMLANAVFYDTLDTFFALMRPASEEYSALAKAYRSDTEVARRVTFARNMERWRWMPRQLGESYVFVNAAKFEADLWRGGSKAATWRVIVGKRSTPTPVFQTTIEGVILNPWWEIPASIVRESVGGLVRRDPAAARARGYVWSNGRYRQQPGPYNALGQMKLVMPNRYSVYMHDTPNKSLFDKEVRAFSHGCIRTDDAIGYAATLLEGRRTRTEVDAIVASGKTTQVAIAEPIPVYITYFTAVNDGKGGVRLLDDIYNRDRRIKAPQAASMPVALSPGSFTHPQFLQANYASDDIAAKWAEVEC